MRNIIGNFCSPVADIARDTRDLISSYGSEILAHPGAYFAGELESKCYDGTGLAGVFVMAAGAPLAGAAALTSGIVSFLFGIACAAMVGGGIGMLLFILYITWVQSWRRRQAYAAELFAPIAVRCS